MKTFAAVVGSIVLASGLVKAGPSRDEDQPNSCEASPYDDGEDDDADETTTVDTETPLVVQQCDMWCWAASAEMVAKHYELDVSQCEVVSARVGFDCCFAEACSTACDQLSGLPAQLNAALAAVGLHGTQLDGPLTKRALIESLDANRPVMLAATTLVTGHFVVVVGYTRDHKGRYHFAVNDPWPGVGTVEKTYGELRTYGGQPWLFTWLVDEP